MAYATISINRDIKEWLEGLKILEGLTYPEALSCLKGILGDSFKDLRWEIARYCFGGKKKGPGWSSSSFRDLETTDWR